MKLHNPFDRPSTSLGVALTLLFSATLFGAVALTLYYPFVVIPIVLLAALIRVIYSVIKGDT